MSNEAKPVAPPEKSLSYIAWSLKEISANLTKLVALQERSIEMNRRESSERTSFAPQPSQLDIPF